MQIDPALKELVLRRTGTTALEQVDPAWADESVSVVARLADPERAVPSLHVVARFGSLVTARTSLGALASVRRDANVLTLKASRRVRSELARSGRETRAADIPGWGTADGPAGRGVVVAVIDWGCDFAHANFRRADTSTRLLALWDQRGGPHALSPAPFGYGRVFERAMIEAALASDDPYTALDYDAALSDLGGGMHGTHVLDIAAGGGRAPDAARGMAPEADLLFVHLRGDDTDPKDTLGDSVRLLEAARWAVDRAGDRPIVINFSLGQHGGPHDGSTPVEQALDALVLERPGCIVVMSTGNYFGADVHAAARVAPHARHDLFWIVGEDRATSTELEVWYPAGDRLAAELIDPSGASWARVALGEDRVVSDGERVLASLYHRARDPNNGDHQIDLFLRPDAPAGRWTLGLHGEEIADGRVHAWIEREHPEDQARFAPETAVSTTTTNTICNGRHTITVGAYSPEGDGRMLPFSSVGPTRDGREKPDVCAPGDSIRAARSSRWLDGERVRDALTVKSGTSMAAPHVAGVVAVMCEVAAPRRLTADEVRRILCETARPLERAEGVDRERQGAGRLDAHAAVEAVRALVATDRLRAPIEEILAPAPSPPPRVAEATAVERGWRPPSVEALLAALGVQPALARARPPPSRRARAIPHRATNAEATMNRFESVLEWIDEDSPFFDAEASEEQCLSWLRGLETVPRRAPLVEAGHAIRKNAFRVTAADARNILGVITRMAARGDWWFWVEAHRRLSERIHGFVAVNRGLPAADVTIAYHRFLPFHRLFLADFEALMRYERADVFIPYWDWTASGQRGFPAWTDALPTSIAQRDGGSFAVGRNARAASLADDDTALPTHDEVATVMRLSTYDEFARRLEGIHGRPHNWSGATMRRVADSPADFLFFMHHAQVDRLWHTWQQSHSSETPSLSGASARLERASGGNTVPVANVLNPRSLGFEYDTPWS